MFYPPYTHDIPMIYSIPFFFPIPVKSPVKSASGQGWRPPPMPTGYLGGEKQKVGPQTIAKLVQITPITMVYGPYNYSYTMLYYSYWGLKTNLYLGGPHCRLSGWITFSIFWSLREKSDPHFFYHQFWILHNSFLKNGDLHGPFLKNGNIWVAFRVIFSLVASR